MIDRRQRIPAPALASVLRALRSLPLLGALLAGDPAAAETRIRPEDLIDETRDARVLLQEHSSRISQLLWSAQDGEDDHRRFESELASMRRTLLEHLAAFEGVDLEAAPELAALRDGFADYLNWQRDELPRSFRAARAAARTDPPRSPARKATLQQALSPMTGQDEAWLRKLDRLADRALEASRAPPPSASPPPNPDPIAGRLVRLAPLFAGSTIVVALGLWFFLRIFKRHAAP